MDVAYVEGANFYHTLAKRTPGSLAALVLITGALEADGLEDIRPYLDEAIRTLENGGLLFVQGRLDILPEIGVYLDLSLVFKYWFAIQSTMTHPTSGLPTVHGAALLFVKGDGAYQLNRVRFPHANCAFCGKTLKDWGGKSHLMHPDGYAISDVWKDLPPADNYHCLSEAALDTILKMIPAAESSAANDPDQAQNYVPAEDRILVGPSEGIFTAAGSVAEPSVQYRLPDLEIKRQPLPQTPKGEEDLWNVVHQGDALTILTRYPDESVDLAFADPPYNLDKGYTAYDDELSRESYLAWCNAWLDEYVRVLKPTGSLFILNLPHWTMYHAAYLNQRLHFQNWIVWDALSEPRGKIMPAHYGLLFYTKSEKGFTFNYDRAGQIVPAHYCLRSGCIRQRQQTGGDESEPLTDIWTDIHRIKHRRDRDYHPCQLPDALMERIILLTTNEGDIVLDALAGTGTTVVVAARLRRRYVAVDIDEKYTSMIRQKISQLHLHGSIQREMVKRPRAKYRKKDLQLELREMTMRLGRLPTQNEVAQMSRYGLQAFLETFPSWGKALKAAKIEVRNGN